MALACTTSSTVTPMSPSTQLPTENLALTLAVDSVADDQAIAAIPAEKHIEECKRSNPTKSQNRDEIRGAYRAQSIKAIYEVDGDVATFLEELDAKRRQLDEQIHRYIKQKERDFKLYERGLRIHYRNAGIAKTGPAATTSSPKSFAPGSPANENGSPVSTTGEEASPVADIRAHDNGLVATQANWEREAELQGIFTPSYLSFLGQQTSAANSVRPSTSAPISAVVPRESDPSSPRTLHRAHSDPVDTNDSERSARTRLTKRTSSSGSESKSLVSVLKAPASSQRLYKRKRVSIAIGDEVVKPSDSVPGSLVTSEQNLPSEEAVYGNESAADSDESIKSATAARNVAQSSADDLRDMAADDVAVLEIPPFTAAPPVQGRITSGIAAALASSRLASLSSKSDAARIVIPTPTLLETDVFTFSDHDLGSEPPQERQSSDSEEAFDISPAHSPARASNIYAPPQRTLVEHTRSSPRLRTSSLSSSQPVSPGFSRPSVQDDRQFDVAGMSSLEIEDNQTYGSMDPTRSLLDRPGSLGESFMEMNAESLRKSGRRRSSASQQSTIAVE